jgi:hypothetical protein
MTGAVDFDACPSRRCYCGKCKVCGFPMHSAVHGPVLGQPPGSKPFGHEFMPMDYPDPPPDPKPGEHVDMGSTAPSAGGK